MTDDKVVIDVHYRAEHWEGKNEFVVVGPGWGTVGGTYTKNEADIGAHFANLAYAEGRMKERERIIHALTNLGRYHGERFLLESILATSKSELPKRTETSQAEGINAKELAK